MTRRCIVCPVDFSGHSKLALRYAGAWARSRKSRLVAVTAKRFDAPPYFTPEILLDIEPRALHKKRALARCLKEFAGRFAGPGMRISAYVQESGPVESVLGTAEAVVMGTHARRGMPLARSGSVTERVARMLPLPMLVVRSGKELLPGLPARRNSYARPRAPRSCCLGP
ncbi:MAG: universal stress protein [Elusimicrobiota bacterium]